MTWAYRGWFGRTARPRCPHEHLVGIYGDQINDVGGWRLRCHDCGRLLDGPVALASRRVDPALAALAAPAPVRAETNHAEEVGGDA